MFIITDNKNKIMHLSKTVDYESNGNVLLDDNTGIVAILVKNVYEVENIPEYVETEKYCYTEEKGFYENVDYVEPINEATEIEKLKAQNESLQEQVTNLQLAMLEMIEGGM